MNQSIVDAYPKIFANKKKILVIFAHPDDLELCRTILNRAVAQRRKTSKFEYRVQHNNGEWRLALACIELFDDP